MHQDAYCKFLFSREQFLFCHVGIPDSPDRLPAIGHNGKYYSMLRTAESAKKGLQLAIRASHSGRKVAITQSGGKYILWVQEDSAFFCQPDECSSFSPSAQNHTEALNATFASSPCLILSDLSPERFCLLTVSNSVAPVIGFQHQEIYYRLIQREQDPNMAVSAVAERACRGGRIAVVPMKNDYGIFVADPSAVPMTQRNS